MTPLEFLAVVLPSPQYGLYCAAELSTNKREHTFVQNLEDMYPTVSNWVGDNKNVYFALASYDPAVAKIKGNKDRRTADNARWIKAFFIDMDNYTSKKAAATALDGFLTKTGLGTLGVPWIIDSGGGLHCYWPLKEAVDITTWKPIAENLKRLCKQEQLTIDMTVTADAARVLRIPDTTNFKPKYPTPRPVRLVAEGDVFTLAQFASVIRGQLLGSVYEAKTTSTLGLSGVRPTAAVTPTSIKLFENSATRFKTIWLATQNGRGCGQLAHYALHASEDGMEPLWRGMLSLTQKCVDGDKASTWLSNMHPYDHDRMHEKLRQIKGPYPCVKFDSENPGVCTQCEHWGRLTNPLALGREVMTDNTEREIEIKTVAASTVVEDAPIKVTRPKPPRGYSYGARGGVFCERIVEDADGVKSKKQIMILPYDMFVVDILNHNAEHTVHLMALRPEAATDVTMPMKAIVSKDETVKALAQQNIISSFGANNDKNLADYVRACVEQSSTTKVAVKVPDSYGWQPDNSYVFAGRIFTKDAAPICVPMPGLENLTVNTEPKGTLDNWRKFIQMLINRRMYSHLAIMLAGASAPFMRFTGIYGLTYHCASTDSGTGKSLALEAAASIWGHPTHYRTGKGTSPVAMQQRLGLLNSLPLITDEITSKNRADFEWFPAFLLDMTEGRGKERMESGANKERLNLSTWMTTCLMSSNTNAVDYLTGGRKHASEGELRRLLEFVQNEKLKWEPHEIEVIKSLQENYGVAGYVLSDYLAKNFDAFPELVSGSVRRMYVEFKATNDERFWMAGVGALVTAGLVMGSKHANIIDLPMAHIIAHLKTVVEGMRANMKHSAKNAEDVLNAYTRESYGNFIVIHEVVGGYMATLGLEDDQKINWRELTRSNVAGRIEHGITEGYIDYFIEEQLLKAYCSSMSFGYAEFKRQLSGMCRVEFIKKDMMARTKGPQMRVNVMKISRRIGEVDDAIGDSLSVAAD